MFSILERENKDDIKLFSKVNRINQYWIKYKGIIIWKYKNSYLIFLR